MQPQFQITGQASGELALQQNRVLRNTFLMLALTMVPTVLGALVGVQMQFSFMAGSPFMSFLLFLGIAFGFMWGIERTKNSGMGVVLLLAFTFFMGLMLSRILQVALGFSNGGSLIAMAAGGTGVIFFSLAGVATVTRKDFSFMGKFLFIGMIVVLLAALANIFFQIPALSLTISAIAVMIFSAYILYDISRIVTGGEDNYISATLAVYLDIYNVFVSLLNLLMAFSGDRD
ncbi:Bax inhibitor-1/YccA family protein [Accumulibacter sp.]|uniref:Bax inhibitor-1/YccA family protein n=1 Tax=Candidatus Accumulibacter proximus TaxID=2954385 RepID=A0A935Q3K7_9PROT|nr:Bax inhibitor-1/YccA family protein [Accumulibacter sp.]MBK7676906.1 Bax inhibitor-1/YccA family protein [Candidatus Accumulibacter proximus]MBL8375869.1 Bax inhibitor-1/YccA family protein [Accumulibacter sp.]